MKIEHETLMTDDQRYLYLIVLDSAASENARSTKRWTVYRVELFGYRDARVIGRELTLRQSRSMVKNDY